MLTGGLGVLAPHTEAPIVTETTVRTDLLQPLQIVTEFRVNGVRENLAVLAVNDVPLPVQEPCRDLELGGVLDNGDKALELVGVELTSTMQRQDEWADAMQYQHPYRLLRSTSAFLQTRLA